MDSINTQLKAWLRSEDPGKALDLAWSPNLPAVSAQLQAEPEGIHYTLTTYDWFNPVPWPANDSPTPSRAIRGADDRRYYIFPPPNSAALNHGYNPTIPRYPKVVLEFDRFAEADFIPENDNMDLHPDDLFDSLSVEIGRITDIENIDGQPSACAPACKGHTISEQESDKAEAKLSVRHLATFHPRREEYETSAHFHIDFIQPVPLRTVNNAVLSLRDLLSAISPENLNVENVWINPHNWVHPDPHGSKAFVSYHNSSWRKGKEANRHPLLGFNLPLEQLLQAWLTATFDDRITEGILACIYKSKQRPATYQEALGSLIYGLEAASAVLERSILKLSFLKRMNGTAGIDESAFGEDPDRLAQRLWQWRNMRYGHREDLKRPSANHTGTLQDPHTLYRYAYTLLCWIALDYLGLDSLKPLTLRII